MRENSIAVIQNHETAIEFNLLEMRVSIETTFCGGQSHMFIVISQNDQWGIVLDSEVTVLHANVYRWLGDMNCTAGWRALKLWEKRLCFVCTCAFVTVGCICKPSKGTTALNPLHLTASFLMLTNKTVSPSYIPYRISRTLKCIHLSIFYPRGLSVFSICLKQGGVLSLLPSLERAH